MSSMFSSRFFLSLGQCALISMFAWVSPLSAQVTTDPDLPSAKVIGAPTIWVRQLADQAGTVTLSNGTVISQDQYGNPLMHPLALAFNLAQAGDVIACRGELNGIQIGKYDPNKPNAVYRSNGDIIQNISVISELSSQRCTIRGVLFQGRVDVPGAHGVHDITFKNINFKNIGNAATALTVSMNSVQGMLRFYNVELVSGSPGSYGGYGLKWGMRGNGEASYDIRGFRVPTAQEHALYLDSVNGGIGGDSVFTDITQTGPSGRTGVQIVNRPPQYGALGPGTGGLYFRRLKLWTVKGGGGSGFTVAGHLGPVFVKDLRYKGNMGAIVFWSDSGKGLYTTPEGYTTPYARLENIRVESPSADRSHIMAAGVGLLEVKRFLVRGNRAAFDFNSTYGGPIANGQVRFIRQGPLATHPGFKSGLKIKLNNQSLSNQQINSLFN